MVDFDNESTIGTPAVDVERISILQRRYDLFDALEDYQKKALANISTPDSFIRARLMTLFLEIQAMLKRRWKEKYEEHYEKLKDICMGTKEEISLEDIYKSIYLINEVLDHIRLTRIDTKQQYNPQDIEKENEIKGF
jgi:hypothetical protein